MTGKTEAPTPRRLRRARGEGDSPISSALTQAASFAVVVTLLPGAFSAITAKLVALTRQGPSGQIGAPELLAWDVLVLVAPLLLAGALCAMAVSMIQTRGVLAFRRLELDFGRLAGARGVSGLVSAERLLTLGVALGLTLALGLFAFWLSRDALPTLARATGDARLVGSLTKDLALRLLRGAVVLGLGFAVVDFALRHRSWMRRLRMTRDEVRREQKETEGDPLLRSARRSAHLELHEEATLAELRRAKVLVTTSAQGAVALTYEESDDAPRVLTHGRGELAERMERVALTDGVPVRRDEALAEALFAVKPGSAIPNSLYEAVALLLGELGETPR